MSAIRMPTRLTLSAYAGPMPRPVVPILFLPRKRSVTLSMIEWYDAITWAFELTTSRPIGTLRSTIASSSRNSASGETTTPLPITEVQSGVRIPLGSRWVANFSPFDHDRVAGVVAAARADAEVDGVLGGEQVGRLALALVAPLGSEHDDSRASCWPSIGWIRTSRAPMTRARVQQHRALATTRYQGRRLDLHPAKPPPVEKRPPSRVTAWIRCSSSPTPTPAGPSTTPSRSRWACCARTRTSRSATTTNPGELDGVLHRAGCRSIVVAGGDGSLHAVVSALHRRHELAERTLGLIPLGTGNDFARALDIPLDPAEAAAALLAGSRAGWT